jgi:hypothetical protein
MDPRLLTLVFSTLNGSKRCQYGRTRSRDY